MLRDFKFRLYGPVTPTNEINKIILSSSKQTQGFKPSKSLCARLASDATAGQRSSKLSEKVGTSQVWGCAFGGGEVGVWGLRES